MYKLMAKENVIFDLIDSSNVIALLAFEKLFDRVSDDDKFDKTSKSPLLDAIYVKRYDNCKLWQIAIKYNISERTLFRYRHKFIDWFYFYYEKLSESLNPAA